MTACYLALHGIYERGPMPPCEGRLIMAHLIPRQLLKREGGRWAIVDARSWVWACGGITGCSGHHGAFDSAKTIRLPREALPDGTEELAALLGLTWWLDRNYRHTEGDQCPPTYGKPSTTSV
jgi:hypothetical protein